MKRKSWKTTLAGVGGICAGIAALISSLTGGDQIDWNAASVALGLVSAGITGLFARDNNVSSEDAGAK